MIIASLLAPLSGAGGPPCSLAHIPALDDVGRGRVVAALICLDPGGLPRISGSLAVDRDFVLSALTAWMVADIVSGGRIDGVSISFAGGPALSGPSAGASIALTLLSLATPSRARPLPGTGGIAFDGSVEGVSGVVDKVSVLGASGFSRVFVPASSYIALQGRGQPLPRGLDVVPLGSIGALAGGGDPLDLLAGVHRAAPVDLEALERAASSAAAGLDLSGSLDLLELLPKIPGGPGHVLARLNIVYLAILRGNASYSEEWAERAFSGVVEDARALLSRAPDKLDLEALLLYITYIDRLVALSQARASGGAFYAARLLSALFWGSLLRAYTSRAPEGPAGLEDLGALVDRILRILNIDPSEALREASNVSNALGIALWPGAGDLFKIHLLYEALHSYSEDLILGTLGEVLSLPDPGEALRRLRGLGYSPAPGRAFEGVVGLLLGSQRVLEDLFLATGREDLLQASAASRASALSLSSILYLALRGHARGWPAAEEGEAPRADALPLILAAGLAAFGILALLRLRLWRR